MQPQNQDKQNQKVFLWGASTAAHQVEGGQTNDWTDWEYAAAKDLPNIARQRYAHLSNWEDIADQVLDPGNYISGDAADHYHRYEEDIAIMKSLGMNSYRFSIEWSRIEPEEGCFDIEAIAHYRRVLAAIRNANMQSFVTLHHFTNPQWLEAAGGVHGARFPGIFARYAEYVAQELGDDIDYFVTINEPESYLISRYLDSPIWPGWPHQEHSLKRYLLGRRGFHRAHKLAYKAIKRVHPDASVGFSHGIVWFQAENFWSIPVARFLDYFGGTGLYGRLRGYQDFLGLQYYMRNLINVRFSWPHTWAHMPSSQPMSDFGWEVYPEGLYKILHKLKKYRLPIFITENGIADSEDRLRADFIRAHIDMMKRAMDEGCDVGGYFYWSLLDNYEWSSGYWPRFGLVAVDFATGERVIRPSAYIYRDIIVSEKSAPDDILASR